MKLSTEQIKEFAAYLCREEKSAATQEKYLRDIEKFREFAGELPVTKELVIAYKAHCIQQGYAVRSVNSMLASVNSILNYLGWLDCRVKSIRLQQQAFCREDQELTKQEYRLLLSAAEADRQLQLILQTICATGIRVSELQYFTVETVTKGEVTVYCKSKSRSILLPKQLRQLLLAYAEEQGIPKGPLFLGKTGNALDRSAIWRRMKRLCQQVGVCETKVYPHNLRKLFARTFYQQEKDIAKLADLLGHSNINTTRIYIITTGAEHRRQIERLDLLR